MVGRIIAWPIAKVREATYVSRVLNPIHQQIVEQLRERSELQTTAFVGVPQRIVESLALAVAKEKGISPPCLYPGDPTELLFWGPHDDLTGLIFSINLEKRCGIRISHEEFLRWCEMRLSVAQLVEECLKRPREEDVAHGITKCPPR
ncbi:MAG: hypothetical protein GXP27_19215 [Planctomycetes bacterium]|nr:hypothetical protein [Planctomycetota bacterium]